MSEKMYASRDAEIGYLLIADFLEAAIMQSLELNGTIQGTGDTCMARNAMLMRYIGKGNPFTLEQAESSTTILMKAIDMAMVVLNIRARLEKASGETVEMTDMAGFAGMILKSKELEWLLEKGRIH